MQQRLFVLFVGLLAIGCPAVAGSQPFPPNPNVDSIFKEWANGPVPGCSLAVAKAGQIIYARGYGRANIAYGIPNTPGTVFHAASLAKQFTAMSVLLVAQRSQVRLDQAVRQYIPELANVPEKITIRQMLQHRSGLRDQNVLLTLAGRRLGEDVVTRQHVLGLVARMRTLNFRPPGTEYSYSNTNYFLAGLIVERVAGVRLSEFARRNIFEPLNMQSSKLIDKYNEPVANRAYGYDRKVVGPYSVVMPTYNFTGPTNLVTTVGDLIRWDRNFDSAIVGGRTAIAEMLKAVSTPLGFGYGLGLMISSDPERGRIIEHNGRDPGFHSHLIRFVDKKLTVALLCNVELDIEETRKMVRKVADAIVATPRLATLVEFAAKPALLQLALPPAAAIPFEEYAGRYYSQEIDTTYELRPHKFGLELLRRGYRPTLLTAAGPHKFVTVEFAERMLEEGVWVTFRQDAAGDFVALVLDDNSIPDRARLLRSFPFRKLP